jgi:A/G-specific adenine glycosylase
MRSHSAASPTPTEAAKRRLAALGQAIDAAMGPGLRQLPWRQTRDPWVILVTEVLLQQTQAQRVADRFDEILEFFGTPQAVVSLGQAGVVQRWSGFGYNARAVRLFRCAQAVLAEHGGVVPDAEADLLALPGIGPYTAAAIQTFAFERDVAVYDTNVARVIARAALGDAVSAGEGWASARQMVPSGRGWHYNQAVLDFGATVCTARRPACAQCPIRRRCLWARSGFAGDDPARTTAGTARPQGAFRGSRREARGAIIECLRNGPAARDDLDRATMMHVHFDAALRALIADGMVTTDGARFALCN